MTPERWQRVEELYHAAYARPIGERAAFLAEACRQDDALRRQVESLLNESITTTDFSRRRRSRRQRSCPRTCRARCRT